MRLLSRLRKNRHGKRGFTLIECVVSIAIFAIMSTMFATFLINSVRVVNLSIANDRDREALMEAIAAADPLTETEYYDATNNVVKIEAKNLETGEKVKLQILLDDKYNESKDKEDQAAGNPVNPNSHIKVDDITLDGEYFIFRAENGVEYMVYLPKDSTIPETTTYVLGGG